MAFGSICLFLFVIPTVIFAHPFDETDSYFYFNQDELGNSIPEKEMAVHVALNWFQVSLLVEQAQDATVTDFEELRTFGEVYVGFVKTHFNVWSPGNTCELGDFRMATEEEAPLSLGVQVIGRFTCEEEINEIIVKNDMFAGASDTQVNRIHIMEGREELLQAGTDIYKPEARFDLDKMTSETAVSFQEEREIEGTKTVSNKSSSRFFSWLNPESLAEGLENRSVLTILAITFLLGLLHTLEAGHSKTILTTAMMHKNMKTRQGLAYALIFTVTHVADIVLLGLVFLLIGTFTDIYSKFSQIQTFSAFALFFISLYLAIKAISEMVQQRAHNRLHHHDHHDHHHHHDDDHSHSHGEEIFEGSHTLREQLMLGFITGLAPCVFGWSVFMLILTTEAWWVLIPSILTFGVGIFIALAMFVFVLARAKGEVYKRIKPFAEWSPIVSALILLGYSLFLIL